MKITILILRQGTLSRFLVCFLRVRCTISMQSQRGLRAKEEIRNLKYSVGQISLNVYWFMFGDVDFLWLRIRFFRCLSKWHLCLNPQNLSHVWKTSLRHVCMFACVNVCNLYVYMSGKHLSDMQKLWMVVCQYSWCLDPWIWSRLSQKLGSRATWCWCIDLQGCQLPHLPLHLLVAIKLDGITSELTDPVVWGKLRKSAGQPKNKWETLISIVSIDN